MPPNPTHLLFLLAQVLPRADAGRDIAGLSNRQNIKLISHQIFLSLLPTTGDLDGTWKICLRCFEHTKTKHPQTLNSESAVVTKSTGNYFRFKHITRDLFFFLKAVVPGWLESVENFPGITFKSCRSFLHEDCVVISNWPDLNDVAPTMGQTHPNFETWT